MKRNDLLAPVEGNLVAIGVEGETGVDRRLGASFGLEADHVVREVEPDDGEGCVVGSARDGPPADGRVSSRVINPEGPGRTACDRRNRSGTRILGRRRDGERVSRAIGRGPGQEGPRTPAPDRGLSLLVDLSVDGRDGPVDGSGEDGRAGDVLRVPVARSTRSGPLQSAETGGQGQTCHPSRRRRCRRCLLWAD